MNYHGKMTRLWEECAHGAGSDEETTLRFVGAAHPWTVAREADAELATLRARVAELEGLARACLPVVRHKEYTEEASCNPSEAARWRDLADRINAAIAPKEAQ